MKLFNHLAIAVSAIAVIVLGVAPVMAEVMTTINFEDPPYIVGNINGQDGWTKTGPYDAEVDVNTPGHSTFGGQSLRISNAITSGSFGDWVFSKPLVDEAGETDAENGSMSGGTRQTHFEASWDFASNVPNSEQPGLQVSTAPDRGDGARMSFVKMYDTAGGLDVDFADYQSGLNEVGCILGTNFVTTTIATDLDRTLPHNIKLSVNFLDGVNNDIVNVYVDGVLAHVGTSWEGYFNECEGNPTRTVDSMIFQARSGGGTALATLGNGFLIDNFSLTSDTLLDAPTSKDQCKKGGWMTFNNPTFKNQGDCVSFVSSHGKANGNPVASFFRSLFN